VCGHVRVGRARCTRPRPGPSPAATGRQRRGPSFRRLSGRIRGAGSAERWLAVIDVAVERQTEFAEKVHAASCECFVTLELALPASLHRVVDELLFSVPASADCGACSAVVKNFAQVMNCSHSHGSLLRGQFLVADEVCCWPSQERARPPHLPRPRATTVMGLDFSDRIGSFGRDRHHALGVGLAGGDAQAWCAVGVGVEAVDFKPAHRIAAGAPPTDDE